MTDSSHRLRFGVYPPGFNQIKLINKLDRELKLVRRGGREHQAFGDWPWLPIAASSLNPNLVHFPQEERGSVFNKKAQEEKRYHWHHLRDMACVLGLACRHDFHRGDSSRGDTPSSAPPHIPPHLGTQAPFWSWTLTRGRSGIWPLFGMAVIMSVKACVPDKENIPLTQPE